MKVTKDWIEIQLGSTKFWRNLRRDLPELRRRAGVSQRDLARVLGTKQGNISMAEAANSAAVWGIDRTVAWLAGIGYQLQATGPEGAVRMIRPWDPTVGRWLADLRKEAGIPQTYLAEILGVSVSTVQTIETQAAPSGTPTIIGYLLALDWTVEVAPIEGFQPVSEPVRVDERMRQWRDRARRRALTRLAHELGEEYAAMQEAVRAAGGSPRAGRGALLANLRTAHPQRYVELYREELRKETPPAAGPGASQGGEGGDQAAGRYRSR